MCENLLPLSCFLNTIRAGSNQSAVQLRGEIFNLGSELIRSLDIPIAVQPFNSEQSEFFRTVNQNFGRAISNNILDKESK